MKLSEEISRLRERLSILETLQRGLQDPELAQMLREAVIESDEEDDAPEPTRGNVEATFQQIADWFRSEGNKPATFVAISEATGVHKSSVKQMVYISMKDRFEKMAETDGRAALVRLKT